MWVIDILSSFWSWAMPSHARVHTCIRTCLSSLRSLLGESEDQGQYCMENFGVGSPLYKPSLDWGRLWVVDWAILKQWVEPGIGLPRNKFNFHSLITKIIMTVVNMWKNQFLPFTQTHLNHLLINNNDPYRIEAIKHVPMSDVRVRDWQRIRTRNKSPRRPKSQE